MTLDMVIDVPKSVCLSMCVHAKSLQSCPTFFNPMDYIAHQAPLSIGFSRQEYWSGLHFLLQRIFPTKGLNPCLLYIYILHWQAGSLPLVPPGKSLPYP